MAYEYNEAPKALDEQRSAFKKLFPTLDDLPADQYWMQPKYDGCLAIVVANFLNPRIITRTGELVTSMPHVLRQALLNFPGWVLFGEAYKVDTPFKDISGAFRRHAPQEDLQLALFDMVPVQDWAAGVCNIPYKARRSHFVDHPWLVPSDSIFVAPALDCVAPQAFANSLVARGGYDGAVLRDKLAPWKRGASKNGSAIKVKPVQSLDLKVGGWFSGKGKHEGRAGGIVVVHNGVCSDVGTGFSDAERQEIADNGCPAPIAEIEFMEITESGKLREPRFKGWRYDKDKAD